MRVVGVVAAILAAEFRDAITVAGLTFTGPAAALVAFGFLRSRRGQASSARIKLAAS